MFKGSYGLHGHSGVKGRGAGVTGRIGWAGRTGKGAAGSKAGKVSVVIT